MTDGTLAYQDSNYPYGHVILGGEPLYAEDDYIMSLKSPSEVRDVLAALQTMSEEQFRRLYFSIPPASYGSPLSDDDFEYSWSYLKASLAFWEIAASEQRYVLFTADQ